MSTAGTLTPRTHAQQTRFLLLLALLIPLAVSPALLVVGRGALVPLLAAVGLSGALVLLLRPKLGIFLFLAVWPVYSPALHLLELENNTVVKLWPEALMAGTLAGLLLAWLAGRTRLVLRVRAPDVAVGLLLLTSVYAAFLTRGGLEPLLYGFRMTYVPLLLYFLTRLLPLSPRDVWRWLALYVAVAALLGLIGLFFHLTGPERWYSLLVPREILQGLWRKGDWRMSSLLGNPLYFAPIVAIAAALTFAHFLTYRKGWSLLLCALFVTCTWLSLTRGSYIMLALAVGVILLALSLRSYPLWILSLTAALVMLVGLIAVQFAGGSLGFLQDTGGEVLASRFPEAIRSIQAFAANPLGYGLGVGHAQRRFATDTYSALQVYDGWYFKVLLEGGVVGFLAFAAFLLTSFVYLAGKVQRSRSRAAYTFHTAMLGIMVGSAVQAAVTNLWEHYMVAGVLWVLLALSVTLNCDGSTTPLLEPRRTATPPVPVYAPQETV